MRPLNKTAEIVLRSTKFNFLFECLFYVWPSDFGRLSKVRHVMGALILTSIGYLENDFLEYHGNRTRALSGLSRQPIVKRDTAVNAIHTLIDTSDLKMMLKIRKPDVKNRPKCPTRHMSDLEQLLKI